jgi:hypothetical protein
MPFSLPMVSNAYRPAHGEEPALKRAEIPERAAPLKSAIPSVLKQVLDFVCITSEMRSIPAYSWRVPSDERRELLVYPEAKAIIVVRRRLSRHVSLAIERMGHTRRSEAGKQILMCGPM